MKQFSAFVDKVTESICDGRRETKVELWTQDRVNQFLGMQVVCCALSEPPYGIIVVILEIDT